MAKISSLSTITTGYLSNAQINANFQLIVTAMNNTLSRDGSSPNTVTANIDMNSKQLVNLIAPTTDLMAATKKYVDDNNDGAAVTAAAAASAAAAAVSAAAALVSEAAALVSENNAETAETNAETAQTAAEAAQTAAEEAINATVSVITSTSNAITCDLSVSHVFSHTFTENTTFTFSNPEATGTEDTFRLYLTNDGTGRTPTWPASVDWSNSIEPDLTTASERNILSFTTIDGGTIWYGGVVIEAAN